MLSVKEVKIKKRLFLYLFLWAVLFFAFGFQFSDNHISNSDASSLRNKMNIKRPLILRVQHAQITIPKDTEDEARKFYCEFLGLREIPKPESLQLRGGFWMEVGAFQVHVGTEDDFDRTKTKAHLAYQVEDLQGWREKLETRGIKIIEGIPIPAYNRFEFRDPFGNRVEFLEAV